jgi:hypothetical protein
MNTTKDKRLTQDTHHADPKELTLDDLEAVTGGAPNDGGGYTRSVYDGLSIEEPPKVPLPKRGNVE